MREGVWLAGFSIGQTDPAREGGAMTIDDQIVSHIKSRTKSPSVIAARLQLGRRTHKARRAWALPAFTTMVSHAKARRRKGFVE